MKKPKQTPEQLYKELETLLERFNKWFLVDAEKAQLEDLVWMAQKRSQLESLSEEYENMYLKRQESDDNLQKIVDIEDVVYKATQIVNLETALDECALRVKDLKVEIEQRIKETRSPILRKQIKQEYKDILEEYED